MVSSLQRKIYDEIVPPSRRGRTQPRPTSHPSPPARRLIRKATHANGINGKGSETTLSCLRCRRSKTRCDGKIPCERCFRLALSCHPQQLDKCRNHRQNGEYSGVSDANTRYEELAEPGLSFRPPSLPSSLPSSLPPLLASPCNLLCP
ncbi:hypothetical protein Naga_101075g1 [Nannochloropsis gaditana]|uniref:Zn(2)-C6 fungal-type domain-containing protein n=1 Tax=Nannochloropsis gaditana TaxID=72520 RepID=W7T852_9STRA|nr:hypothetical protein Naga_101075g1 [Nannochloropsis gaditana]